MKNSVLILGSFGYHNSQLDGQTIKTRSVYQLFRDNYKGNIKWFCSMTLRKKPYRYILLLWKIFTSKTIVMIYSSSGGFRTMLPTIYRISKLLSKNIIYIAIGSTQVDCIEGTGLYKQKRDDLLCICRNLKGFLAETNKVKNTLIEKYNYKNVDLLPNFRYFDKKIPFCQNSNNTLKLVFMARITPKKGCNTIFKFVDYIKSKNYDILVDFYGPIDIAYKDEFMELIDKYKKNGVKYNGVLQPDEIYHTLSKYDIMLFPTLIDGIPGSIIDAYISSLTVVATNWEYSHEIIDDNINGFIVPYNDPEKQEEFNERIIRLYNDRDLLQKMKYNAYKSREKYSTETAWKILNKYL